MCAKKFMYLIISGLCKNRVFLTVQFFDTTVHFLYTLLLSSLHFLPVFFTLSFCLLYNFFKFLLHSPSVSVTHSSSSPYSYSLFYTVQFNVFHLYMMQRPWIYETIAKGKWGESKG